MDNSDKKKYMDDVFFSTSPVEKGLVFDEIKKNINKIRYDEKIQDLCKKHRKDINELHIIYTKKLYNVVMSELIVYKKLKHDGMMWNCLINSI